MSDAETKLEILSGRITKVSYLPESNNARCNLEWFRKNLIAVKEEDHDKYGPMHLKISKPWCNKVELWKRITIGKDPWFEKVSEYPLC